jgi:AcrR family transcriptional regulator
MKAKSDLLAEHRSEKLPVRGRSRVAASPGRGGRMSASERRAQILAKALEFFAEYGLTAQTRALAEACGISQRLLYSVFPNKAALIEAVYQSAIAGPFKAVWLEMLKDRTRPIDERLGQFYREYYDSILTRRWLRLFLYASLAEVDMAPSYIGEVIRTLLETLIEESAQACGATLPDDPAVRQEMGWVLHGNISHLAIRRHIYRDGTSMQVERVIDLHVRAFLAAVPVMLDAAVKATCTDAVRSRATTSRGPAA